MLVILLFDIRNPINTIVMRKASVFISILVLLAFPGCQSRNLVVQNTEVLWQQVDSLSKLNLPRSQIEVLDNIREISIDNKNTVDYIKAVVVRAALADQIEEEALTRQIEQLEKEVDGLWSPAKQMVHSILGDLYQTYYNQNRWRLLEKGDISSGSEDLREMGASEISARAVEHYLLSLDEKELLASEASENYLSLLLNGDKKLNLRPTLYDLLVDRCTEKLLSGLLFESSVDDEDFLRNPALLGSREQFTSIRVAGEKVSHKQLAISLLGEWLNYSENRKDADVLYDVDLQRLKLMHFIYDAEDRDELYENALGLLLVETEGRPNEAMIMYEIAGFLMSQMVTNEQELSERNYGAEAYAMADKAIGKWPESDGGRLAAGLIQQLTHPSLYLNTEETSIPGQRLKYVVTYNNIKQLHTAVYRLKFVDKDYYRLNRYDEDFIREQLDSSTQVWKGSTELPGYGDYLAHRAELEVETELPYGTYVLVVSDKEESYKLSEGACYSLFQVTNLAFMYLPLEDGNVRLAIKSRDKGQSLEGVYADFYNIYGKDSTILRMGPTDRNGETTGAIHKNRGYTIVLKKGDDIFFADRLWYSPVSNDTKVPTEEIRSFIFSDRKVYRPGQKVSYKTILLNQKGNKTKVISGSKFNVTLRDTNGREVSSQSVTTNEYGSVSGSFILPSTALSGSFSIVTPYGSSSIQVEEYKRPRFEISFEPFRDLAVIGDSITVKANATTLTGMPLADARVEWKVKSSSLIWRSYLPSGGDLIASGSAKTSADGKVMIVFQAKGSNYVNRIFSLTNFLVEVDITDASGETRSESTSIALSDKAYSLNTEVQTLITGASIKTIPVNITLTNVPGEPVEGELRYYLEKVETPKISTPRPWGDVEHILWKQVPENKDLQPVVERLISSGTWKIKGQEGKKIDLKTSLATGHYRVRSEITDIAGDTVKSEAVFKVVDTKDTRYLLGEALTLINSGGTELVAGSHAEFIVGSAYKDVEIQLMAVAGQSILLDKRIVPGDKWNRITIPTKDVVGTIRFQAMLIRDNKLVTEEQYVSIKEAGKELILKPVNISEKLKPGEKEKWTLKVTGADGKAVDAEVLVLMYDAALDAYKPNYLSIILNNFRRSPVRLMWQVGPWGYSHQRNGYFTMTELPGPDPYPSFVWDEAFGFYGYPGRTRNAMKSLSVVEDNMVLYMHEAESDYVPITMQNPPPPAVAGKLDVVAEEMASGLKAGESIPPIRTNLSETAFFFPHLRTLGDGSVEFEFTVPDALTRWRFMALAHMKDGNSGTFEQFVITSRDLMVMPNMPRIVREGDDISLAANVFNTTEKQLGGMAYIQVRDAVSGQLLMSEQLQEKVWEANAGTGALIDWKIEVPQGVKALEITLSAISGQISDGEKHLIAVLPSRTLITETKPLFMDRAGNYKLSAEALAAGKVDGQASLTFTYNENAAWEMLSALTWLSQRPYESSDQAFNRLFSVAMAQQIFKQNPQIEMVMKLWNASLPGDEDALSSALEKDPGLKAALLTATPWLDEAMDETHRRRVFARLVEDGSLESEFFSATSLLKEMQLPEGAWAWFKGMYPSEETTVDIVSGFGMLKSVGYEQNDETRAMLENACGWILKKLEKELENIEKQNTKDKQNIGLSPSAIKKLYALSYFPELSDRLVVNSLVGYLENKLPANSPIEMAYATTVLHRSGKVDAAKALAHSLSEYLLEEGGSLFFRAKQGPYWYQAPIESHVAAIEAFRTTGGFDKELRGMEKWLFEQKHTQNWSTTRATMYALYALASSGQKYFSAEQTDRVLVAGKVVDFPQQESASGYRSFSASGPVLSKDYADITIEKKKDGPSFATVHLSYFADTEQVEAGGFLKASSVLYKRGYADGKESWLPVDASTVLEKGDRLMQRLTVEVPQDLDFVHINAPRAAILEPVDMLSGYRYSSGLGYYLAVTDAGSDLFVDNLSRGTHTVSWEMTVSHSGKAVQGPVAVSCFYAPSYSGHSGSVVIVTE